MRCRISRRHASALFAALLALPAAAQPSANLSYQNRGHYREGIRTAPSTGPNVDLIAALVDYHEPYSKLPGTFRVRFYLPEKDRVSLTIRESDARYFYWLDQVIDPEWQAGKVNLFEWPTGTVIQSLTWRDRPLSLDDLAATIRLGGVEPGKVERVVPAALYYSQPPQTVDGYVFVFRPEMRVRLGFKVFPEQGATALDSQAFPSVDAKKPQPVKLAAKAWPDGWYRLEMSGYSLSDNSRVDGVVHFYHARRLGN
jgi:hypothetical protein